MSASRRAVKTSPRLSPLLEFTWQGRDKRGVVMKGQQTAKNANMLRAELRKQGITPITIKPKAKPLFGNAGKTISAKDIAVFSRQLATMMKSGVPIVMALEIIAGGQKNAKMKTVVNGLKADIEGGSSIYEAMCKYPVQFDELYRNLVRTGEAAGVLETVLESVADYKENTEALKGKIKKALYYPIAVVAVAIIVSAILLVFVIPTFETTFNDFGAELPAFTLFVLKISRFMVNWWWLILIFAIGGGVAFMMAFRRSTMLQHTVDRLLLKMPVIGNILHQATIARFSRTLALTFSAGVPLVDALETVAGATGNLVYEKAVVRMREDVAVGYPVNVAMKQVNLFPHMVVQMTAIGEEAGALDTMLFKVAEYYEMEVNNSVDALTSLIEPFIIVVLGVLVGGMVVAMYLPIFKLAATV